MANQSNSIFGGVTTTPISSDALAERLAGQKTAEGGETFNDYENNKATAPYTHAEGRSTTAGSKGFILLNHYPTGDGTDEILELDSVEGIEVGDVYSYKYPDKRSYDLYGEVIVVSKETNNLIVSNFVLLDGEGNDTKCIVWIPAKPEIGTTVIGSEAHSEGRNTIASQFCAHAEGFANIAAGMFAHTEGRDNIAVYAAHAEGRSTKAKGTCSHTEGESTSANGSYSHAEGCRTLADAISSHAEGIDSSALGKAAHAEGEQTKASGNSAHSEGVNTNATGDTGAHAEGQLSTASGKIAPHAEGYNTLASGDYSHSEGKNTVASGTCSHAGGLGTVAKARAQTVVGTYNSDNDNALLIVGKGASVNSRSNAFEVLKDGSVTIGGVAITPTQLAALLSLSTDIETALDNIIAVQNSFIGGNSV
jgi:hypothetical protein